MIDVFDLPCKTRMHSSRMRTARSLTVSCRIPTPPPRATMHAPPLRSNHACPPDQPCMPPPQEQPRMPPRCNHTCPPRATMHTPPPQERPRMPPPEQQRMHPPWTECGHTLLKILPCHSFVAGGNFVHIFRLSAVHQMH